MGCLPLSAVNYYRDLVKSMPVEEQQSLTWKKALRYVVCDTSEMARWMGLRESGLTPYEALKKLKGIV